MKFIHPFIPPSPRTKSALEFSSFQIFFPKTFFENSFPIFSFFLLKKIKKSFVVSGGWPKNSIPHFFPTEKPEWSGY
jgi:hypothetical protein